MPLPPLSDIQWMLDDTGVTVSSGIITGKGILEQPQQLIQDGMVITTDWTVLCRADQFGALLYGSGVIIDGSAFLVREAKILTDGVLCELSLEKIAEPDYETPDIDLDAHGPEDPSPTADDWFDGGSVDLETYGDDREGGSP